MEPAISFLTEITYMRELILDISDVKDLIRTITYSHLRVRKLCAH